MKKKGLNEFDKIRKKYSYLFTLFYQINNILIAIAFLWGSFEFYSQKTQNFGVTLFVIGSLLMFIKPVIAAFHTLKLIAIDKMEKHAHNVSSDDAAETAENHYLESNVDMQ